MTSIPATARLLEGYVAEGVGASTGERLPCCGLSDGMVDIGERGIAVPVTLIRLDLTHPIAFAHVLRLVAETVGMDARGGVVLRSHSEDGVWSIHGAISGTSVWFADWTPPHPRRKTVEVSGLPGDRDAYTEALAAIAAVVLEDA